MLCVFAISLNEELPNAFWEAHLRPCQSSTSNPSHEISYSEYNTNVTGELQYLESKELAHLDMYSDTSRYVSVLNWDLSRANSIYKDNGTVTPLSMSTKFCVKY